MVACHCGFYILGAFHMLGVPSFYWWHGHANDRGPGTTASPSSSRLLEDELNVSSIDEGMLIPALQTSTAE